MRLVTSLRLLLSMTLLFGVLPATMAESIEGWNYREHSRTAWRPYGPEAFEEARRTRRPVFVLIYSDRCHWCRKYELEALEQPQVRNLLAKQLVPVSVDNDRQKELGRRLGARFVPTTLILAPDGQKLLRFHGVQSAADLSDTLLKTLELWRRGESSPPDFGSTETCCPVTDDATEPDRSNGLRRP